jgi:type IV secretion system protein VirD4
LLKGAEVLQLDPRIAITFTPGLPPIWTRLIRSYEEKGALPRPRGFLRRLAGAVWTLVISALLFVLAAIGAAAVSGELRQVTEQQSLTQPSPAPAGDLTQPWNHLPQ